MQNIFNNKSPYVNGFILFIFVIITVLASNFWFGKIGELQANLAEVKSENSKLSNKVALLQKVGPDILNFTENVAVALPSENPMIFVVSQIRSNASDSNVSVTSIRTIAEGGPVNDLLFKSEIEFVAEGKYNFLIDFLNKIRQSTPLTYIEKVVIDPASPPQFRATVDLAAFWSDFPTKLPSITEPISGLSQSESDTLSKLSKFELPRFTDLPPASPSANRNDPFSL